MAGAVEKAISPVVPLTVAVKVSVWLDSSLGPAEILVAKLLTVTSPAVSSTAGGSPANVKVGASLTALTVIVKVCAALVLSLGARLLPLSARTRLNVAVPLVLAAGV